MAQRASLIAPYVLAGSHQWKLGFERRNKAIAPYGPTITQTVSVTHDEGGFGCDLSSYSSF